MSAEGGGRTTPEGGRRTTAEGSRRTTAESGRPTTAESGRRTTAGTDRLTALMAGAVEACVRRVESGGVPFVGVLVAADGWVSDPGVNLVHETGDPTAHAEVVALRQAARDRGSAALRGATLLATGEPCALCYRVADTHGIAAVRFAVDRDTAAAWGFDYRAGYAAEATDRLPLAAAARRLAVDGALAPFIRYFDLRRADATLPSPPPTT
ncbi:nucleoside deaminase [Streptomyces flavofungini]|uniref:nucleoside deaminase n=1 Tax=Streptomyces flavofungini TaxID=68200 RepID=UPI0025B245FA|nr:deaminase [Streptomyces flavofungini]WJV48111.1 deaminase [Streptomyces flavofungini]